MALTAPGFPRGNSYAMAVTSTSSAITVDAANSNQAGQFMFSNGGANTAFFTYTPPVIYGGATPVAVAPTAGVPANGVAILAGSVSTFSLCAGAQIAAICAAGLTTTLYVTPLEGM